MRLLLPASLKEHPGRIMLIAGTLFCVSYMFYRDEGNYDFRWMLDPGDLVAFLIWFTILLAPQLAMHELPLYLYRGRGRAIFSLALSLGISLCSLYILL